MTKNNLILARKYAQAYLNINLNNLNIKDLDKFIIAKDFINTNFSILVILNLSLKFNNNKIREDLISKFITKFNLNKSFSDLLNLLILNKRIFILSKVLDYIIILYQEDTKNYIFDISSPEDISKNNLNFLVNYLEKKLNIKVDYNLNINKKLIAGIRAESCNNLWDSSIQGKLQKMLIELVN